MELPVDYDKLHFREKKKVREEYVRLQNNKCWYCNGDLNRPSVIDLKKVPINVSLFPKNFFKYPVHLHHNHDNGMTIGAVHNYCNAVLWQYHGQ